MKEIIKGITNHVLDGETKESIRRIAICNSCEHIKESALGDKCNLCGCLLKFKTKSDSKCPIDKW
jgi:hypothetical protein